ncbi:hypothetical protein OEA41_004421 [Lepraria neglecta]|uniref:Uncharacterized protein n=1 Tax=Lepraria neglecta TaxID=209136 RepID=A0AAD9YXT7_9LECA|nr:hypothetical protein OEA41_004421 [Lepraria neglecta]
MTDTIATFPPQFTVDHSSSKTAVDSHILLAGSARQLVDLAVQSEGNCERLRDAIKLGNNSLLDLSAKVVQLTVNEVRALYRAKKEVIQPVSEILTEEWTKRRLDNLADKSKCDMMCYILPEEYSGSTLDRCSEESIRDIRGNLYNYLIYCQLFHHGIDEVYDQLPHPNTAANG